MTRVLAIAAMILSVFVGAVPASGQHEIAPADYARVNAALAETHAVPRYERLATATNSFAVASQAFCSGPGDAGRASLGAAFHDAMDAWMGVQHLRFGPVESFNRAYRFYFWPQARAKAADAVAELVATGEEDERLARIGQANVAVQGLLAAEVLFHDSTLVDMARRQPRTREEFAEVSGVGAAKLEQFAEPFLTAIDATLSDAG